MSIQNSHRNVVIIVLIFTISLSLALALPWLASEQGLAAQSEISFPDNKPLAPKKFYVAITGTGSGGLTWSTAFTNVQDALVDAAAGPAKIWVAKGVYYPDVGKNQSDNDETSTFVLTSGVALYGGFEFDDLTFSDRDWENNITVLSGDIDGDDTVNASGIVTTYTNISGTNSYHVVTSSTVDNTAVLDGFTITAGSTYNVATSNKTKGGGMINLFSANPTLKNLKLFGNKAFIDGGGMYNHSSAPQLTNVTFSGNSAYHGGGMYNYFSSPELTGVTFVDNYADDSGGGMHNSSSKPALNEVQFFYNESGSYGGGMSCSESDAQLQNVIFSANSGVDMGGGLWNYDSFPELTNTIFLGNFVTHDGGGMYNMSNSGPLLTNVTFSGNSAGGKGGGIEHRSITMTLRNTILWNNMANGVTGTITATINNQSKNPITVTHSLVESSGGSGSGWIDGGFLDRDGNIDGDPLFITSVDPSTAPTTNGDLHLREASQAIDLGNNDFVMGVTSDLDGKARIKDGDGDGTETVDMSAYEAPGYFQLSVSRSGDGSGSVTSIPGGIDCGDTCSSLMYESAPVILTALPDKDSIFLGWSGACSGIGKCELVVDATKTVNAVFEPGLSHYLPLVKR